MPVPAHPREMGAPVPGSVRWRQTYRDAIGRPLTGTVAIRGTNGVVRDGVVVPPTTITVEVLGGVIDVPLPPDQYTVAATLHTAEGERVTHVQEVTIEPPRAGAPANHAHPTEETSRVR